jgi:hypothetical protein
MPSYELSQLANEKLSYFYEKYLDRVKVAMDKAAPIIERRFY